MEKNKDTQIVCITPMKNESWILDRFLKCTSLWADHIILLDQNSEDNSVEIANRFKKVRVIKNENNEFNDHLHWSILLDEARKIECHRRIIIAIDCDEFISANSFTTNEWNHFIQFETPGSMMIMSRLTIGEGVDKCARESDFVIGFVDDNITHIKNINEKKKIHNIRLAFPEISPKSINMNQCKLLHYNLVDFKRCQSKMRWYMCYEKLLGEKSVETIIHQYYPGRNFNEFWSKQTTVDFNKEFIQSYEEKNIDMTSVIKPDQYYWDNKILDYFKEKGSEFFGDLPIWEVNWKILSSDENLELNRTFVSKLKLRLILKKINTSGIRKITIGFILKFVNTMS